MSLTKKQKQVFDYISQYINKNGYSPTQAEIKDHFGFKSLGSVQDYIKYLKSSGHLINDTNSVRGLKPALKSGQTNTIEIPLHGRVAAGNPIEALEGVETIEVPQSMISKGNHFALTISGESMIEDGILDGDIVVIKEASHASNGETIVATIDGEATIKRFHRSKNKIELRPANSTMLPIEVKDGDFSIKGILVGLIRAY